MSERHNPDCRQINEPWDGCTCGAERVAIGLTAESAGVSDSQANTGNITDMAKRGYSREFTPQTDRRVRIEVDRVPPTLYNAVLAKAKREGVSLRALVLRLLSDWAATK